MSVNLTAFSLSQKIAEGTLSEIITTIKCKTDISEPVFIFNDKTGTRIEVNFEFANASILAMTLQAYPELKPPADVQDLPLVEKSRGRPKLGVVAKEITLLPRQWEWLSTQPGGASATIRRLVDEAKKLGADEDNLRRKTEAAYKFLSEIGGNLPNYEESLRALFANQQAAFKKMSATWPNDIRQYALKLAF